ncbi:MAG: hypothetical protein GEU78_09535 [Actinobacteria bacterium]|nr:hypothetical protein [Actinomycetota bacterium]
MNETERDRIAAATNALRPDWPLRSIRTFIDDNLRARGYRDTAIAMAYIACDPETKTPKRVLEAGPWWTAATTNRATSTPDPFCRRCRFVHGPDQPCEQLEPVPPDADTPGVTDYAAARAALKETE